MKEDIVIDFSKFFNWMGKFNLSNPAAYIAIIFFCALVFTGLYVKNNRADRAEIMAEVRKAIISRGHFEHKLARQKFSYEEKLFDSKVVLNQTKVLYERQFDGMVKKKDKEIAGLREALTWLDFKGREK